ncbi:estrogen receptor beta-like [Homarus americanus]|uniref:estrogen receptor beta-like n=1 Tax=Homarus americanus TaxID=6706 RepID=UPI001C4856D8|nr:estrogen receptor beta-like [Homarus americanus]
MSRRATTWEQYTHELFNQAHLSLIAEDRYEITERSREEDRSERSREEDRSERSREEDRTLPTPRRNSPPPLLPITPLTLLSTLQEHFISTPPSPPSQRTSTPTSQRNSPSTTPPSRRTTSPSRRTTPPSRRTTPPSRRTTPPSRRTTPPSRRPTPPTSTPISTPLFHANISTPSTDCYSPTRREMEEEIRLQRKVCGVCGDVARSLHFGGLACDSCKAFFRRAVLSKAYRTFVCTSDQQCVITVDSRRSCQECSWLKDNQTCDVELKYYNSVNLLDTIHFSN